MPFFSEDDETPSTPKADALFVPRENPRALVIRPVDQWPSRGGLEKISPSKQTSSPAHDNGRLWIVFYLLHSFAANVYPLIEEKFLPQ